MSDADQTTHPDSASEAEPVPETDPAPPPVQPPEPSIVDGQDHNVDPRSVKLTRVFGVSLTLLIAMLPFIVFTLGKFLGDMPMRIYLALLGVLLLLVVSFLTFSIVWPGARYRRLLYLVHEGGMRIRRGVFWRKVIWIPISRVQHTDVSQGPFQRQFGLATLTVHTAGTAGASISLAGLEHGVADRLCDHLRPDRANDAV